MNGAARAASRFARTRQHPEFSAILSIKEQFPHVLKLPVVAKHFRGSLRARYDEAVGIVGDDNGDIGKNETEEQKLDTALQNNVSVDLKKKNTFVNEERVRRAVDRFADEELSKLFPRALHFVPAETLQCAVSAASVGLWMQRSRVLEARCEERIRAVQEAYAMRHAACPSGLRNRKHVSDRDSLNSNSNGEGAALAKDATGSRATLERLRSGCRSVLKELVAGRREHNRHAAHILFTLGFPLGGADEACLLQHAFALRQKKSRAAGSQATEKSRGSGDSDQGSDHTQHLSWTVIAACAADVAWLCSTESKTASTSPMLLSRLLGSSRELVFPRGAARRGMPQPEGYSTAAVDALCRFSSLLSEFSLFSQASSEAGPPISTFVRAFFRSVSAMNDRNGKLGLSARAVLNVLVGLESADDYISPQELLHRCGMSLKWRANPYESAEWGSSTAVLENALLRYEHENDVAGGGAGIDDSSWWLPWGAASIRSIPRLPVHLSNSNIQSWKACRLQFLASSVLGLSNRVLSTHAENMGVRLHAAMLGNAPQSQGHRANLLAGVDASDIVADHILSARLLRELTPRRKSTVRDQARGIHFDLSVSREDLRKSEHAVLQSFTDQNEFRRLATARGLGLPPNSELLVLSSEQPFTLILSDLDESSAAGNAMCLRGSFDRIERIGGDAGGIVIRELKTSTRRIPIEANFQLILYAYAFERLYPGRIPIGLVLESLLTGHMQFLKTDEVLQDKRWVERGSRRPASFTELVTPILSRVRSQILEQDFRANPSDLATCDNCFLSTICHSAQNSMFEETVAGFAALLGKSTTYPYNADDPIIGFDDNPVTIETLQREQRGF